MDTTTISSKFQIVIPLHVRRQMHLHPGQKIQMISYNNHIVLVPLRPIEESRGFLKGMDSSIEREEDRL